MIPNRLDHILTTVTALALVGSAGFLVTRNEVRIASPAGVVENGREAAREMAQLFPGEPGAVVVEEPAGIAAK